MQSWNYCRKGLIHLLVIGDIKEKLSAITSLDKINSLFKEAIRCADLESFIYKMKQE